MSEQYTVNSLQLRRAVGLSTVYCQPSAVAGGNHA